MLNIKLLPPPQKKLLNNRRLALNLFLSYLVYYFWNVLQNKNFIFPQCLYSKKMTCGRYGIAFSIFYKYLNFKLLKLEPY